MNSLKVKAYLAQAKSDQEKNLLLAAIQDAFKSGKAARQREVMTALKCLGVSMEETTDG